MYSNYNIAMHYNSWFSYTVIAWNKFGSTPSREQTQLR